MASPGNYSLRLRHPPEVPHVSGTDASHYFSLGGDYSEITLEWDWYVPDNFAMRFVGSGAKMFRMWSTVYDERSKVGMSFHALDGDYNPDNAVMYLNRNEGGGMGADWSNPIPWINSSDHGTWMAIKHVAIAPTASSQGYTAMYKDGILMAEGYWDNYDPNLGKNLYSKGYMGGWCSPGYDEQTDFYIDNFRITSGTVVVDPPPIIGDKTDLDLIRWYADFTNYSDGTSVETAGLASSNALVSSTKLLNGKKSARDTITGGDTDVWGECGFLKDFSADSIGEGDEVWFRMYTYYPTGFSFNTPGQGDTLSFMRQRNANGTNPAVTIKVSRQNGQTTSEYDGRWQLIADNSGVGPWPLTTDNSFDIIHNKWEAWELYVKYSSNATLGKVRFYKDGIQIGPETSLKTLNELDDPTKVMYHMWWEGAVPQDQEFYFALPAVAVKSSSRDDTLYMSRDTNGNPIIGLEVDSTPIDPDVLLAPSNFHVTGYGTDYIDYAWDYNGSGQEAFSLDTSVGLNNFQRYTDSISPIARTYRVTASPNTYTGGRIKATTVGGATSAWSNEVWITTQSIVTPPPSGGVTDLTKIRWHSSGASWDAIADGATMNGIDGMWSATSSEISSEVLLGGHKVAKDRLDIGGDYGFGFGRTIPDLPYGAEMWFRVWLWHPPAFDFSTDVNVRKTMRVRSKPTSTSLDVARINNKDAYPPNEIGAWYTAKENAWNGPDNGSWCLGRDGSQDFRTSQWDCLEVYTNSTTSDTAGRWKVWMNGVLVGEVTQKTLTNAGDVLQDCMYLSNWNDGVPQVQHYYWASPAIAVRHSGRDDTPFMDTSPQGFPFIGTAT